MSEYAVSDWKNAEILRLERTVEALRKNRMDAQWVATKEEARALVRSMIPDGAVTAVLDIDSDRLATFDEEDKVWLEKIVTLL